MDDMATKILGKKAMRQIDGQGIHLRWNDQDAMESDWQATLAATSPPEKPDRGRMVKSIMNNYICPAETLGIKEADGHLALVKLMTGKITT
ncbi:hypothetical protein PG996_012569 [Apiospora saccharicola]|uniref:Uncharacterized protein n=1 Tax=Apiospora saccharicola TaxID=335842 RepID=A0ABR1U5Q8_9PEZI